MPRLNVHHFTFSRYGMTCWQIEEDPHMGADLEFAPAIDHQPTDAYVQRLSQAAGPMSPEFDRCAQWHTMLAASRVKGFRFMLVQIERGEHCISILCTRVAIFTLRNFTVNLRGK
jgi:hypothetical protein